MAHGWGGAGEKRESANLWNHRNKNQEIREHFCEIPELLQIIPLSEASDHDVELEKELLWDLPLC